jgi:hypothetical protein
MVLGVSILARSSALGSVPPARRSPSLPGP